MGAAKIICEDYASLLLNEHVQISALGFDDLPDILEENRFYERGNRLVEMYCALGTGAFVEYLNADEKPVIDYIRADMIYPLSWDGDNITECAFGSVKMINGKPGYYVQLHTRKGAGYEIRNVYIDEDGKQLPTPEDVQEETAISPLPLFQILRTNAVNSIDLNCPMGISVFGTATEQLKAVDIAYDSYVNEFILGKKRLMVPQSMATIQMQADGTIRPTFDPSDVLMYVYQQDTDAKQDLKAFDSTLRIDALDKGLQRMLDILSKKCGLGVGRYQFENGNVKTATEVISEKSDLYQSIKRHEKPLRRAITGMVQALSWLTGGSETVNVSINFDDSIIEDKRTTIDQNILLVNSGLRSKVAAIMSIDQCDENTAKAKLQQIADESQVNALSIDRLSAFNG